MNSDVAPSQVSSLEGAPQAQVVGKMTRTQRINYIARGVEQMIKIVYDKNEDAYYEEDPKTGTYVPLDEHKLKKMVTNAFVEQFTIADPKEVRDTITLIKDFNDNEVNGFNRDLIYIAPKLYWDGDSAELVDEISGYCAYRLFSTRRETKHAVRCSVDKPTLLGTYEKTYKELTNEKTVSTTFDFIKTWADGNDDIYLDIVRAIAYCFLKKKPVGSYILIGEKRNGKTTFIGLLQTIFGLDNCSAVQLSQLGDPHFTHKLKNTLLNAPDEEEDVKTEASGVFKTIADHGVVTVPVMRSNQPLELPCDFMCFYPMNHMPQWHGSGASACLERSLVIPFYADLSRFDKVNDNFAKTTYTKDTMSKLLGVVFAYAKYYSSHQLEFSKSMMDARGTLVEDSASGIKYRERFEKTFCGFDKFSTLYEDYYLWCCAYDYVAQPKAEFKFLFRRYLESRTSFRNKEGKRNIMVYKIPGSLNVLYEDFYLKEMKMDIKRLHERKCSIVERIDAYMEEKKWT